MNNGTTTVMSDEAADQALARQTAPRVTKEHLQSIIIDRTFIHATPTMTICILTLRNGFTVTGESACASPENYDAALGEKFAFEKAFEKLWALEGYALKERLFDQSGANSKPAPEPEQKPAFVIGEGPVE